MRCGRHPLLCTWHPQSAAAGGGRGQRAIFLAVARWMLKGCATRSMHVVSWTPTSLHLYRSSTDPRGLRRCNGTRTLFLYRVGYLKATRRQEHLLIDDDGSPSALCLQHGGPMRFTLFRVTDIVHPSFNERVAIAKNNNIADPLHFIPLRRGDVDANLLANILLRAVALCRSSIGSRIDVTGCMRNGVGLAHVDSLLHGLRNE
ncbi:hypothetical protein C3747_356g19 [Trypanosoma cruzi]|uniref:Uncharacterized protein n=1 Tax=Trypanosoma cruzi TaxID=5693 RepID=A0A2V2V5G0_TRYCR|nr:hypothetical protein C3747_356g19 [Trypanosoma cruzi]